ncbi:hypothetical protein BASA61_005948 [Batrachochytrium salamandrivorans]|nr:hypothetical protein BASA61_005948 [Batrachochytrium salamandrivorans]
MQLGKGVLKHGYDHYCHWIRSGLYHHGSMHRLPAIVEKLTAPKWLLGRIDVRPHVRSYIRPLTESNPTSHSQTDPALCPSSSFTAEQSTPSGPSRDAAAIQSHCTSDWHRFSSEKPLVASIHNLIHLLDRNQLNAAFSMYAIVEQTVPSDLAHLPVHCSIKLVRAVLQARLRTIRHMSIKDRLSYAAALYTQMRRNGIYCDFALLRLAIDIYGRLGAIKEVELAYFEMLQRGLDTQHLAVLTYMCRAYILCNDESSALIYFEQLQRVGDTDRAFEVLARAYTMRGDPAGMKAALSKINLANNMINASALAILCQGYHKLRHYDTVYDLISQFKLDGGVLDLRLYRIQMQCAVDTGNYATALAILSDMRASGIQDDLSTIHEELVAHAFLGEKEKVWMMYASIIKSSNLFTHAGIAMAKMMGALKHPSSVNHISKVAYKLKLPLFRTLHDLLRAYTEMGDVTSVEHIIKGDGVDRSVWHAMLVCAMWHNPTAVDSIIDVIRREDPRVDIEAMLDRAYIRLNRSREGELDRWESIK